MWRWFIPVLNCCIVDGWVMAFCQGQRAGWPIVLDEQFQPLRSGHYWILCQLAVEVGRSYFSVCHLVKDIITVKNFITLGDTTPYQVQNLPQNCDPKLKWEWNEWHHQGFPCLKKFHQDPSRVKVMLIMTYSVDVAIICEGLQYGAGMHRLHYGTIQG